VKGGVFFVYHVFFIALVLAILGVPFVVLAGYWRVFEKAGRPGWASLIPVYNEYVLLSIARQPGWWVLLLVLPWVSLLRFSSEVVFFLIAVVEVGILFVTRVALARTFGKGTGFGIGLALLPFIFFCILGFGDANYVGPGGPMVVGRT
jgi:hypothetical protein